MHSQPLQSLLARARLLVFDFDGTLVDSNEIKWRGFEYAFRDFPEKMPAIMEYCRGSNHTIRREKFRHVCESILGIPYTRDLDRTFHERYAEVTTEAVIRAPEIAGASTFLNKVAREYETAILSSTPDAILKDILEAKGWRALFRHTRGAPVDKAKWLSDTRELRQLRSEETLFLGDMVEDLHAATAAGCMFVGVRNAELAERPGVACFISNFELSL